MKQTIFSLLILSFVLVSCYRSPNEDIYYSDLDMVKTDYSRTQDYKQYQTFAISDSIQLAANVEDVDEEIIRNPAFLFNIQNTIREEMISYGYTEWVEDTTMVDSPDVYIPINIYYLSVKGISWYPIYWGGGGYGWGYPYYGWGGGYWYPSYTWVPTSYQYDQASLLLDWMDIKNAEPPKNQFPGDTLPKIDVVWHAGLSGVIRNSSEVDRNARIRQGIQQAFSQSEYLKKN